MITLAQTLQDLTQEIKAHPTLKKQKVIEKYKDRIVWEMLAAGDSHQLIFYLGIKIPPTRSSRLTG